MTRTSTFEPFSRNSVGQKAGQVVERKRMRALPGGQVVAGSNPAVPTRTLQDSITYADHKQAPARACPTFLGLPYA